MQSLRLLDTHKTVMGCPPAALTGAAGDGDYVSLKNFGRVTFILAVDNATTVTGGAVTLKQATDVAGTGEKALSFTVMHANIDTGAGDAMTETAVTSDTFTTDATANKNLLYQIEIKSDELDVQNNFDCIRIDVASMANAVAACIYELHDGRYGSGAAAITD